MPQEINANIKTQYFKDGTFRIIYNSQKTNFTSKGKFEISDDNKSLTHFPEKGASYTIEIVKLTNKELEIKGISGGGIGYDSHYIIYEE